MSHPKNSTTPPLAQEALLTQAMPLFLTDVDNQESGILQVCPDKPASEALNLAAMLMNSTREILGCLTDSGMGANEIFAVRFLVESSAALVEASLNSVEFGNCQGGAQ